MGNQKPSSGSHAFILSLRMMLASTDAGFHTTWYISIGIFGSELYMLLKTIMLLINFKSFIARALDVESTLCFLAKMASLTYPVLGKVRKLCFSGCAFFLEVSLCKISEQTSFKIVWNLFSGLGSFVQIVLQATKVSSLEVPMYCYSILDVIADFLSPSRKQCNQWLPAGAVSLEWQCSSIPVMQATWSLNVQQGLAVQYFLLLSFLDWLLVPASGVK